MQGSQQHSGNLFQLFSNDMQSYSSQVIITRWYPNSVWQSRETFDRSLCNSKFMNLTSLCSEIENFLHLKMQKLMHQSRPFFLHNNCMCSGKKRKEKIHIRKTKVKYIRKFIKFYCILFKKEIITIKIIKRKNYWVVSKQKKNPRKDWSKIVIVTLTKFLTKLSNTKKLRWNIIKSANA